MFEPPSKFGMTHVLGGRLVAGAGDVLDDVVYDGGLGQLLGLCTRKVLLHCCHSYPESSNAMPTEGQSQLMIAE